jgi:serine/threonine-protein kinase
VHSRNADRRSRVDQLLAELLDLPAEERPTRLESTCAGDPGLRAEVEELLRLAARPTPALEPDALPAGALWSELSGRFAGEGAAAAAGMRIGPWRLLRELGSGGMGTVYLAERADGEFEQTVAVKLLRPGADSDEILQRFEQERQILASLGHPSIARLIDGGRTADGRPFVVMEYVEGRPIDRYCDQEGLTVDQRLELFCQVGRAVQHAHRNLVVHRDLKPSNIVVTGDGEVKLLDFGIAKVLSPPGRPREPLTRTLARVLTPEYASPEQVLGRPIATASDLYQLGLLLYELLCGGHAHPLHGGGLAEIEESICRRIPPRPSTVAGDSAPAGSGRSGLGPGSLRRRLRGDLDTIVMTALRKEPEARYPSVERMLEDIDRHLAGRPISVRHGDRSYRLRKFLQRNRTASAAAALLALLVVGYAATTTVQSREIARQRDRARNQADRAERVQAYLTQVIAANADPAVLDLAAERLGQLDPRPDVKVEMLHVLGNMNLGFGRVDLALPLLEDAAALAAELHGADSDQALDARATLAAALQQVGRLDEAAGEYRRIAGTLRRQGSGPARLGQVQGWRGELAVLRGEYEEAGPCLREALAIRRRFDAEGIRRLRTRGDRGQPPLEVVFPGTQPHLRLARAVRSLADFELQRGGFAAAEMLAEEALDLERLEPGYPPSLGETLYLLGRLRWSQDRLVEAESLFAEVLAVIASYPGREKEFVTALRLDRARLLTALGRPAEARAQLEAAIPGFEESGRARFLLRAQRLHAGALLDWAEGDAEAAGVALREAIGVFESRGLARAPRLAEVQLDLGRLLAEQGHREEALGLLEAAGSVAEAKLLPGHPLRARVRRALAAASAGGGSRRRFPTFREDADTGPGDAPAP